jgi:hypothetical protein
MRKSASHIRQSSCGQHLVGADMNESPDTVTARGFKHNVSSQNVGLGELETIAKRIVHV